MEAIKAIIRQCACKIQLYAVGEIYLETINNISHCIFDVFLYCPDCDKKIQVSQLKHKKYNLEFLKSSREMYIEIYIDD